MPDQKQQVVELLQSFGTDDRKPIFYINPGRFVQHNLTILNGAAGFSTFLQSLPQGASLVKPVRVFQDGDLVFTHSEYNLNGPKVGFDIFRFEGGRIVEHWDNLQETPATPSPGGHTMTDGPTTLSDLGKAEANKSLLNTYMDDLLSRRRDKFPGYFDGDNYVQHNPWVGDGLTGLTAGLQALAQEGKAVKYERVRRVLGEGNFVLVVSEGVLGVRPTSFYDMYRVQNGKIAEHWDTLETIPSRTTWRNSNGKF